MGVNDINMAFAAQFRKRRTNCGWEWVEMKSTWFLLLNSGDDRPAVGNNEWKWDQHDSRCAIQEMTYQLWVRMGRK